MVEINRSLNLLFPPFRRMLLRGLAAAHAQRCYAYAFETWRPTERQAFLYAQGRTTQGIKVTWARPGKSFHEYGLAVDLVFDGSEKPGVQWSWEGDYADERKGDYERLAAIMKAEGMEWLGDKNIERAHFQLTLGMPIAEVETLAKVKGMLGLWDYMEKRMKGEGDKWPSYLFS